MSIEMPLEEAPLSQLRQTPIDSVLHIIDEGLVHLPTYRELYYRWERQQWKAGDIDFSEDRKQWEAMSQDEREMRIYALSAFFQGEACVTDTLAPYVLAMPDEDMRIFLTTQLVDEARHTVFFERFFRNVMGVETGKIEDSLAFARQYVNDDLKFILIDSLTEVAERIRQEPRNMAHLVEGVTLYHIVVEATMALAGQRNMLEIYRTNNLFPAFRGGFTAVARDESRHVVFGVKFLRDMIRRDNALAQVIDAAIDTYAPIALRGISPHPDMVQRILSMGGDPWVSPRYAMDSLAKKLRVIGLRISAKLPEIPPPPVGA